MNQVHRMRRGDDLRKAVARGDFRAGWNALAEMWDDFQRNKFDLLDRHADLYPHPAVVMVGNESGVAVPRFGVLQLGAALINPSVALPTFQQHPSFAGIVPGSPPDVSRFAVLLEPLPANLGGGSGSGSGPLLTPVGRAVIAGAVACLVNVTDTTHGFAVPVAGNVANLTSAPAGGAVILSPPAATGVQWCQVRLGGDWAGGFAGSGSGNTAAGGSTHVLPSWRIECVGGIQEVYRTDMTFVDGQLSTVSNEYWAYDAGCCDCQGFPPGGSFTPPGGSGGSGASGGGGGSGTISVACAPGVLLPATVYAASSNGTGGCSCGDGSLVALGYTGGIWEGTYSFTNCATLNREALTLSCVGADISGFRLSIASGSNSVAPAAGSTLSPLNLIFPGVNAGPCNIDVTISATGGGGAGGGGPGGGACCPQGTAAALNLALGGVLASLGTVALTWFPSYQMYSGHTTAGGCGGWSFAMTCDPNTGEFDLSGQNDAQTSTFFAKASPTSCSPLTLSWSGKVVGTGACLGAFTASMS